MPLDEVLLEVERFDLGAGDDHLDVLHAFGQLLDLRPTVLRGLEVRADPGPQRLRLADVEDVAAGVPEEVDARLRRQPFQLVLEPRSHLPATVAELMRASILRISTVVAALALAPAAHAAGPSLVLGATEDAVRSVTLAESKTQMDLLALAGFRGVRITQIWVPGEHSLTDHDETPTKSVISMRRIVPPRERSLHRATFVHLNDVAAQRAHTSL